MISKRLKALLEENGIPFEVVPHDPAYTAQQLAAGLHVPGREFVKAVVVRLDERYALAAVPAHRLVDVKALARVAGVARCKLATEAEFRDLFPECEVGAMPPVGRLYGLPTYVDEEVTRDESVVANAGTHAEAVRVRYEDLARVARPTVGRFAVPPPSERARPKPARRRAPTRARAAGRKRAAPPKAGGRTRAARKKTGARKKKRAAGRKKVAGGKKTARGKKAAVRKSPARRKTAGARKTARGRKKAPKKK
jgi:Ala-tRNA(Pro) deacylase